MEEQLLQLAQQFLFSEAGKKLIGEDVDLDSIKSQVTNELQSKINSFKDTGKTDKVKLSREERKQARQDKRSTNAQERLANKEARQERGGTIGQFTPEFKEFKIKGRLIDKTTQEPISGVKVQPLIKEPIYLPFGKDLTTQSDGTFTTTIKLPVLPYNNKILVKPLFLYTKSKYLPSTQEVMTLDREVKSDLSIFPILNIEEASKVELAELQKEANEKIEEANKILLSLPEKVVVARRKSIMKVVDVIQGRLFPLALQLLIVFGITKLSQKQEKICPSNDLLLANIARRNRIVKQLNQIFITIAANTALAVALNLIAAKIKEANISLSLTPVFPGFPILTVQQVREILDELEQQNKDLNKQILVALIFLVASLTVILLLLKGIDELTEECAGEANLNMEPISQELTDLTAEAAEEGVVGVNNINGFTLEVQTLDQNAVGTLKRRQAIGKNAQGIVMVKGDASFSSNDQVLLNELAYYIQSNDLKAY